MILFAPMQGYSTAPVRRAHAETIGGIDEYFTPFIRLEKGLFRPRDLADTDPLKNIGVPTVPQILARSGAEAEILISMLSERGYHRVDLNFCCPYSKVIEKGYGADMLFHPERLRDVFSVLRKFPEIHFSAKLRLPVSGIRSVLQSAPLDFVTLHPRTADQGFDEAPDWEAFSDFTASSNLKVIYNGNIRTADQGAAFPDLMIGRGLLENPLLALEIRKRHPIEDPVKKLQNFHNALVREVLQENGGFDFLKRYWEYFLPQSEKRLRKKICKSRTIEEYLDYTEQLFDFMNSESQRVFQNIRQDF